MFTKSLLQKAKQLLVAGTVFSMLLTGTVFADPSGQPQTFERALFCLNNPDLEEVLTIAIPARGFIPAFELDIPLGEILHRLGTSNSLGSALQFIVTRAGSNAPMLTEVLKNVNGDLSAFQECYIAEIPSDDDYPMEDSDPMCEEPTSEEERCMDPSEEPTPAPTRGGGIISSGSRAGGGSTVSLQSVNLQSDEEAAEVTTPETPANPDLCQEFVDVEGNEYAAAIETLRQEKVVCGRLPGVFATTEYATKAELAKIFVLSLGLTQADTEYEFANDVNENEWFFGFVNTVLSHNGFDLEDGAFNPHSFVTKSNFAAFLSRVAVKATPEWLGSIINMTQIDSFLTRAEAAQVAVSLRAENAAEEAEAIEEEILEEESDVEEQEENTENEEAPAVEETEEA